MLPIRSRLIALRPVAHELGDHEARVADVVVRAQLVLVEHGELYAERGTRTRDGGGGGRTILQPRQIARALYL